MRLCELPEFRDAIVTAKEYPTWTEVADTFDRIRDRL
jgi:hypothetical protein